MAELNELFLKYNPKDNGRKIIIDSESGHIACRQAFTQSQAEVSLKEYFFIILLNRANRVLGYYKLSEGGITGTVADIRLAFATALKCAATGMIICHNHPSGNRNPSGADNRLTEKFKQAGEILDIQLLDHIILAGTDYYSYADEGRL